MSLFKFKLHSSLNEKKRMITWNQFPLLLMKQDLSKKKYTLSIIGEKQISFEHNAVFFLKIHRADQYTAKNLQKWLDIVNSLKADFYIICDNKDTYRLIRKKCIFFSPNIKVVKSEKRIFKKFVESEIRPFWRNAAYAHLTSFYLAYKNGYQYFWNIDADDTMFALETSKIVDQIYKTRLYAKEHKLDAFSLDMWFSRSYGKHWSFGVTFIQNPSVFIKLFEEWKYNDWFEPYKGKSAQNLDALFTYLRDKKIKSLETFFWRKAHFIHSGDLIFDTFLSSLYYWDNGRLKFPLSKVLYPTKEWYCDIPLHKDVIQIGDSCEDVRYFWTCNTFINRASDPVLRYWKMHK